MKRRTFKTLSGLSGLGLTASIHYLWSQKTLGALPKAQGTRSQPPLSFVALGDTGIGNESQYAVAKR